MRKATLQLLQYISEASTPVAPPTSPVSRAPTGVTKKIPNVPKPPSSGSKKPTRPLIDPSVMGEEGRTALGTPGGYETVSKGAFGAIGAIGGGKGLIQTATGKLTAELGLPQNLAKRGERMLRAQQEGLYRSTNVGQFFKNLGVDTIPLRDPEEPGLITTIKNLLSPKKTP